MQNILENRSNELTHPCSYNGASVELDEARASAVAVIASSEVIWPPSGDMILC
jgi:hypothetical protein